MSNILWPHKYRKLSIWLLAAGVLLSYAYFKGYRPAFLALKTFAFASAFIQKQYLVFIENNILDELAFICIQLGLLLQIFTEESKPKPYHDGLRLHSFLFSVKYTTVLVLIAYVFLFGYVSVFVISLAFITFCLIYIFRLRFLIYWNIK